MRTVGTVLALVGALLIANSAGPAKKKAGGIAYYQAIDRYLRPVTLTEDQKTKLAVLEKEYEPRFKDAYAKEDVSDSGAEEGTRRCPESGQSGWQERPRPEGCRRRRQLS